MNFTCLITLTIIRTMIPQITLLIRTPIIWFFTFIATSLRFNFCFEWYSYSLKLHLHPHCCYWTKNLVAFTPNIKLNTFIFIRFPLFRTHTRVYGLSIVLQLSTLISTNSKWIKKSLIRVYINKCWPSLTCMII